eukprot:1249817-Pyramimonas_sp.AAC.1
MPPICLVASRARSPSLRLAMNSWSYNVGAAWYIWLVILVNRMGQHLGASLHLVPGFSTWCWVEIFAPRYFALDCDGARGELEANLALILTRCLRKFMVAYAFQGRPS